MGAVVNTAKKVKKDKSKKDKKKSKKVEDSESDFDGHIVIERATKSVLSKAIKRERSRSKSKEAPKK